MPWATYLGTAVADVCDAELTPTASFMAKQSWQPVTCTRTDTLYEAFDGDFRQHLGQIDGVLDKAGWRSGEQTPEYRPGRDPSLVSWFDYDHTPPRDPDPSQIAAAASWPNVVRLGYVVPVTLDFAPAKDTVPHTVDNATVEVTQAPRLPTLDGGQAQRELRHQRVIEP